MSAGHNLGEDCDDVALQTKSKILQDIEAEGDFIPEACPLL